MNKKDLIRYVSDKTLVKQSDLLIITNTLLRGIKEALEEGEMVSLNDFGSFSVKERKARTALNPRTQEVINVPAKRVIRFKPSMDLKKMVNDNE
jgi:DNA-binding protein HU-beta